jgi:chromosome segregation protein
MFKLQRLEITGFKSFADHTEIVFTGDGITAVVGPNGCGKSNVSDAIAWVLGEQRAKTLRGAEMKDVVFQGTKNRKPGGMAEVVLHMVRDDSIFESEERELEDIDEALNEIDENAVDMAEIEAQTAAELAAAEGVQAEAGDVQVEEEETEIVRAAQVGSVQTIQTKVKTKRHWKPRSFALDFAPGEAVSVTRRLYLSGESEYELNGRTCRLRDIQDLFAGTGLSGSHYAIIEQGRIGQILSAKPTDRRSLIEEAAGISKFRTRQRAAEARLENARTNLGRISDIVSEIETQANSLRRQAAKTRRYTAMREEFRVLIRQLFTAEGGYLSALVADLEIKLTEAVQLESDMAARVAEKEEVFRGATQSARQAEENLASLRQRHADNALERDRAEREHRYQNEQITNLHNRFAVLKGEIEAYSERLDLVRREHERLQAEEQSQRGEAERAETALAEAEKKYQAKLEDVEWIESGLEAERTKLLQHTAAVERFDEIGRQLESNLERMRERAEGLKREGVRADEAFTESTAEAGRLAEAIVLENAKLNDYQVEKQNLLTLAAEARENLRKSEDELKKLRDEFARKRNRLETLQELDEKRAVYAPQVQKLFAEESRIGVKFAGTLADRLNVEEKAEKAVENLFGNFLQAVLVDTEKDARKVSGWLAGNDVGRIAVLVTPKEKAGVPVSNPKTGGSIAEFLGVSEDVAGVLRQVFPREMSAKLVESFDGRDTKDGEFLVNYDGDLLIGGKLFVSGRVSTNGKNTSLLAFKRELRELEKAGGILEKQINTAETETEKNRAILIDKEEKTVDLQSLIIKVERGLLGLDMQEKSVRQEIERAERHQRVVGDEIGQIGEELAEIQNRRAEAKENSEKADLARIAATEALDKISQELGAARSLAEADNSVLNEKRTLAATSNERRRSAQAALRRVETEEKELESRLALQNLEIGETENKIKQLGASIIEISGIIASAGDDLTREHDELASATAALTEQRGNADAMSEELAELNRNAAEARNERASIEVRQTEAVTLLRNINEKCTQELNISLAELVEKDEIDPDLDLEEIRGRTEDLRQRLDNFGAINMLALEELGETEERLTFLTSQRQDIIDGLASTEEALREIKIRSREKFREAFEAINIHFMEFFRELFGGGRGEMTLLESDDILEAGIEVVAQPPGKRLQNILLLSGGEKAMTAISLVMAIFKYRPSPFCLLDEVDAPLDDANVGRFVSKIAEMSDKTQFIVITHNKRTMEAAKALYGVTMQEAGVSKVVSVKFE